MKQIPVYLVIMLTLALLAIGCGGGGDKAPAIDKVDFSLIIEGLANESGDIALELIRSEESGAEQLLVVSGEGSLEGASALIGFDGSIMHPALTERGAALDSGDLFFALENRDGVVPIAFHALDGRTLRDGDVVARIRFENGPARGLSITSPAAPPENLVIDTGGGFNLSFDEVNPGDLNADGTVTGIDIFPIAAHFMHNSDHNGHTATDATDNCVDGNKDGVVNGSDVFLISVNFGHVVDSYNIYWRENEQSAWMLDITENRAAPDYPTECFPSYFTDPSDPAGTYVAYMVRTLDEATDTESADSEIVDWGLAPTLSFVTVSPTSTEIDIDGTQQFTATAHWSDSNQTNVTAEATWTCEHEGAIATFNSTPGLLTGLAAGSTTVWATYETEESNHPTVEVSAAPTLESIEITPVSMTLSVDEIQSFTAIAHWHEAPDTDVTDSVTWTCEHEGAIASFSGSPGELEGIAAGNTNVWANYMSEESNHAPVEVTAVTLSWLDCTPISTTVQVDGTRQFTATAHWSDSSTTDVTALATWTCEDEGTLATFNSTPGLLTGVAEGDTSVWATYQTEESTHASVEVLSGAGGVVVTIEEEMAYSAPGNDYQFRIVNANVGDIDFSASDWDLTTLPDNGFRFSRYKSMDNDEMDDYRDSLSWPDDIENADRYFRQSDPDFGYTMEPRYCNTLSSQLEIYGQVSVPAGGGDGEVYGFSPYAIVPYPFDVNYLETIEFTWHYFDTLDVYVTMHYVGIKEGTVKVDMFSEPQPCLLLRAEQIFDYGAATEKNLQFQWLGHDGRLLAETNSKNYNESTLLYTGAYELKVEEPFDP